MITGKKILFTSHTANFSKFNRPLMSWLRESGNEVHYASAGEEEVLDCDKHFTISFTRNPLKLSNIRAYKQLKKIIDTQKYDIIHTHTPMGSVVTRLAARNARRKKGTRVIYTAHGFHFFKGAPLLNWATYYPIEKHMAKHTNTLITINKEDYELAKRRFITDVQYIPGVGIDQNKFDRTLTKAEIFKVRRSLNLKQDDFVMIYLAELSKRKNQLWLIESIAPLMHKNPKFHLLLAGMDSLQGKCQQLVKALGLENNIHFLGYRKDIVELLRSSNLVVSSSLQEGLPVNIMEAMYTGLPVVAIDCRGSRDLIQNKISGFLLQKNAASELRDKIELLYTDSNLYTFFAQNSQQIIKKEYLLAHVLPRAESIYNPKKVVIHLLNSRKFSGAENIACGLIKDTSDAYISYYCSPAGDINAALKQHNVHHIGMNKLSYFELKQVIKKYKPDIIHAHDFRASIIASFFSHKLMVISHIHQNPQWLNKPSLNFYSYKLRINKFQKILVVTDAIKNNKIFTNTPEHKVITRYNKVDKDYILKQAGKSQIKKYDLGFCGRLEAVKQPFDFIKIVSEIKKTNKNVKAIMIGDGSLREDCLNLIEQLGLKNTIKLVGFQANPYKYIKSCRFLVITSQAEGFGLVAIEAILLDVIVISYNLDSIRELMGKKSTTIGSTLEELVTIYNKYASSAKLGEAQIRKNKKAVEAFVYNSQSKYINTDNIYER